MLTGQKMIMAKGGQYNMKKIIVLTILSALMVLPSCGARPIQNKVEEPEILEDTLAHEEIFGETKLELKEERDAPAFMSSEEPIIGIQSQESGSNIHVRFVAAVKIDGDLASATAVWTRTMYYDDTGDNETAHKVFKTETEKPAAKAYTTLKNGEDELTISAFNTAHSTSFNYFVVYTMLNIPKATYADYVLKAYVTVNDGGELSSKVLATTVDQKTQFSYDLDKDKTGYFGVKKSAAGAFSTFNADANALAGNYARFVNVSISKDDSFVLVNSASDYFDFYGYDKVHAVDSSDAVFERNGTSQFAQAKANGSHYLYLSSGSGTENYIYRTDASKTKTFYLKPNDNWYQKDGSGNDPRFALYVFNDEVDYKAWYSMTYMVENNGTLMCDVTYSDINSLSLIFCRMNGAQSANEWGNKYNQTGNLGSNLGNRYEVPAESWDGSGDTDNWSTI